MRTSSIVLIGWLALTAGAVAAARAPRPKSPAKDLPFQAVAAGPEKAFEPAAKYADLGADRQPLPELKFAATSP